MGCTCKTDNGVASCSTAAAVDVVKMISQTIFEACIVSAVRPASDILRWYPLIHIGQVSTSRSPNAYITMTTSCTEDSITDIGNVRDPESSAGMNC